MKRTISTPVIHELEFQKSKFITYLIPISSEDNAKEEIKTVRKLHPKATHHCVAYITGDIERSNDDGEPASSAGLPMLQVLRSHDLDNVLAVVVRYFGGSLLGVGGLIRAYGGSVSAALQEARYLKPELVSLVQLKFPYEYINAVESFIESHGTIETRAYDVLVLYNVKTKHPERLSGLMDETRGTISIQVLSTMVEFSKEVDDG